jgi:parvulin-like peptidyl-prolyl isomerase
MAKNFYFVTFMFTLSSSLFIQMSFAEQKESSCLINETKQNSNGRWIVNKIVARVNGGNILQSDLELPQISKEGEKYTLKEIVMDTLYYQQAAKKHLLPTAQDIERQIVSFKISNNLAGTTDEEFEQQLKESGFTLEQYKKQLARIFSVENVKKAETSEKTVVTSQDVEDFYKKNISYTKETYHLKIAYLNAEEKADYKRLVEKGKIKWKDLSWVNKKDLDIEYADALKNMNPKQISMPIKIDSKYVLLKILDKKNSRIKTLRERYGKIEKKLHMKKRKKYLKIFEKNLIEKASIAFL